MDTNHIAQVLQDKKLQKHLNTKINRQFKTCRYIGDIVISEDEYIILKAYLRSICRKYLNTSERYITSPIFAVALVQIGIHKYDGRFWPHVEREIGMELPGSYQKWIGRSFYKTLEKYNKYKVAENEMMNNILLHCFITNYYASDLFDFLFAYYQIDLERDLTSNSKEMRDYLMQSMASGENTARAYKIKKHTSDAVAFNTRGCKIRVGKILRFMDNALFYGLFPRTSQNRIAQLFCKWADESKKFNQAKKAIAGLTKRGEKRYSSPYLRYNGNQNRFELVLPPQYIHLATNEELPNLHWKIVFSNVEKTLEAESENCVTGCKTRIVSDIYIPSDNIFDSIRIELIKNDAEVIHKFTNIRAACIRFFDNNWELIHYTDALPIGDAFAFTHTEDALYTDSDAVYNCEYLNGLNLYSMELIKGDIIRLPDGRALPAGSALEDGLLKNNLKNGVYVMRKGVKYPVFSAVPSIYFRMSPTQERGTLIRINEEKYRFDIARAIKCNMQDKTDEYGYILRLSDYIKTDGIFRVNIDIPNSRKANDYSFAVINQFDYKYEDAPFIYKKEGKITFSSTGMILGDEHSEHIANNSFVFRIDPDIDYLPFTYQTANENLALRVYLPAFKWKFDDGAWHTERPEEIWHAEFPKMIYLKFPDDTVCLDMPPLMTDDNEDAEYSIKVEKNKEKHLFVCDTRKMLSWFGFEDIIRPLSLHFESISFVFLRVITHCFLANSECQIVEDRPNRKLWFRSSIIGFSDCVADVYLDGILIAEKVEVKSNGFKLSIPFTSGKYRIEYFEADEEDDFGATDYRLFDTKECNYKNTKDLSDKTIQIVSVTERRQEGSIFSSPEYVLRGNVTVSSIQAIPNEIDSFTGVLSCYTLTPLRVKVTFENPNNMKVGALYFWSDEEDGYIEFMYDKIEGILVLSEDESTSSSEAKNRYLVLYEDSYYYNFRIK